MYIGSLINVIEDIFKNNSKSIGSSRIDPINYRGGKTTSNMVYIFPDFSTEKSNTKLMNLIYQELLKDYRTSSLKIEKNDPDNKIKISNLSIFIKPYVDKNPKRVEDKQIETLYKIFRNLENTIGSPFKIKIGKKTYDIDYNSHGMNVIKRGTRIGGRETKSDIIIKTENAGDVYISLKGNTSLQWSGVSDFKNKNNQTYPSDINNFIISLISKPKKTGWCKKITDNNLLKKAMYGKNRSDNGNQSFGPENVNHIIIGENLSYEEHKNKNYVEILGIRTYDNGDDPIEQDHPHIQTSNDTRRNDLNDLNLGFANIRFSIWRGRKGTLI